MGVFEITIFSKDNSGMFFTAGEVPDIECQKNPSFAGGECDLFVIVRTQHLGRLRGKNIHSQRLHDLFSLWSARNMLVQVVTKRCQETRMADRSR